jgi:hypothetical protein
MNPMRNESDPYWFHFDGTIYISDTKLSVTHYFKCFRAQRKDLRVIVNKRLNCMLGDKSRTISMQETSANGGPIFKKDGTDIVLLWPKS